MQTPGPEPSSDLCVTANTRGHLFPKPWVLFRLRILSYWEITMAVRHFKREVESLKPNEGLRSSPRDPAQQWLQECALSTQWRVVSPIHGDPSLSTGHRTRLEGDRDSEEGWCGLEQKKPLQNSLCRETRIWNTRFLAHSLAYSWTDTPVQR